jgi:hypothetical protein
MARGTRTSTSLHDTAVCVEMDSRRNQRSKSLTTTVRKVRQRVIDLLTHDVSCTQRIHNLGPLLGNLYKC